MPVKPIAASAILAVALAMGAGLAQATEPRTHELALDIKVTGLKSEQGVIAYCLSPKGGRFPECDGEGSQSGTAKIVNSAAHVHFGHLAPGEYAVAVFHDKNANGKLDTMLGIPKEGYGFSNNPGFMMRAPKFSEARITVKADMETEIRLRHIL